MTNEELEALAVRCETEIASLQLDYAIATALWGPPGNGWSNAPHFTYDIDRASEIAEEKWLLIVASDIAADGLSLVKLGDPSATPTREAAGIGGKTLALTWCAAGLRSLKVPA